MSTKSICRKTLNDLINQVITESSDTLLIEATHNQNLERIQELVLIHGAHIHYLDNAKRTSLMYAIIMRNQEMINLLISLGASVNCITRLQGSSALMMAINFHDLELCKLLISKGANINYINSHGKTPLMLAIQQYRPELIDLIIHHPDFNFGTEDLQYKLLEICFKYRNILLFEWLLSKKINPRNIIFQTLFITNPDFFHQLIRYDVDINSKLPNGQTLLLHAINIYQPKCTHLLYWFKMLIDNGADINAVDNNGCTALISAAKARNLDICSLLLSYEFLNINAIDKTGYNALSCLLCSRYNHKISEIVSLLLDHEIDASITYNDRSMINYAFQHKELVSAIQLIEYGIKFTSIEDNEMKRLINTNIIPLVVLIRQKIMNLFVAKNILCNFGNRRFSTEQLFRLLDHYTFL